VLLKSKEKCLRIHFGSVLHLVTMITNGCIK